MVQPPPLLPKPTSRAERQIIALLRAQFLFDPDIVCSFINSDQPNLAKGAPLALNILLAPGATTTLTATLTPGFIHVFTTIDLYVDVPFAITATLLMDGHLWYFDTGLCPFSYRWRNWQETVSQWQAILTNNALVNVNVHGYLGGFDVEAKTFSKIKSVIKPLVFTLVEYGSPDGGG